VNVSENVMARVVFALSLLGVWSAHASAQTPDHAQLFRAVQAAPETQLNALLERWRVAFSTTPGGAELVDALVEFRRYELTGSERAAERARELAERARDRAPDNAWLHYASALVVAHGPEVQSNGAVLRATGRSWSQQLGLDARAQARRAAERALELDSLHAGAAVILAEVALQLYERDVLERARLYLQRVLDAAPAAAVAATLARVQSRLRDHAAALSAAQRALLLDPANPVLLHTAALVLFPYPGKAEEGAKHYFAAVRALTPQLADRLFEELRPIATPADTLRWKRATLELRKQILSSFWNVRAGLAGLTVAERLAEHYRRLASALERYPRLSSGPVPRKALMLERPQLPIDERGELLVRHGEPDKVVVTPSKKVLIDSLLPACDYLTADTAGQGWRNRTGQVDRLVRISLDKVGPSPPVETWVYQVADESRLFTLIKCPRNPDFIVPYEMPCRLVEYSPDLMQQSFDVHACGSDTPERRRILAQNALRSDTHNPNLDRRIPFNFDLLSFRGRNGQTDLLAPVALLADSIEARSTAAGQLRYTLALHLAVIDTAKQTVIQSADTTALVLPRALASGDRLSLHTFISTPATDYAFLKLVIKNLEHPANGAHQMETIRVPRYAGDTLMISDVLLGNAVPGGNFVRGGRRITLMPFARFVDGRFRVFYELYNLPRGTFYQTQLLVQPVDGRPQDGLRTDFQDEAAPDADGVVRVLRTMGTELRPGRYRLTVRIRLGDNRFVEKTRQFIVGGQ
jgi:tetratricopeptide (TPR) repeat protein